MTTPSPITKWLDQFAACVRNRQIEQGRELFDPGVCAFGTRAEETRNLTELVERQWTRVWLHTHGFRFLNETVEAIASDDDSMICVLALWDSQGEASDGRTFTRRGRCSILLRHQATSPLGLVAVHTHFSKTPLDEL